MGELMHDALGVGLAATQLGVLHRVLVYKAYVDDPVTALVNPVFEWMSDELELGDGAGLAEVRPGRLDLGDLRRRRGHDTAGDGGADAASALDSALSSAFTQIVQFAVRG